MRVDIRRWKCLTPAAPTLIKCEAVIEERSLTSDFTEYSSSTDSKTLFQVKALLPWPVLLVGVNNLLSGRVVRVQSDYYSYEFGLRKVEARV